MYSTVAEGLNLLALHGPNLVIQVSELYKRVPRLVVVVSSLFWNTDLIL